MSNAELLAAICAIRTNQAYQAAEALRRKHKAGGSSAAALATDAENSAKLGAILLLIGVWQTIALMLKDAKDKDLFFEELPICHMRNELRPAIKFFRTTMDDGYAKHFDELADEQEAWLDKNKKGTEYRTANCNFGLQAFFG
jgi:hypothetical protein